VVKVLARTQKDIKFNSNTEKKMSTSSTTSSTTLSTTLSTTSSTTSSLPTAFEWRGLPVNQPTLTQQLFYPLEYPQIDGPLDVPPQKHKKQVNCVKISSFFETIDACQIDNSFNVPKDSQKTMSEAMLQLQQACVNGIYKGEITLFKNTIRVSKQFSNVASLKTRLTVHAFEKHSRKKTKSKLKKPKIFRFYNDTKEYIYFPKTMFLHDPSLFKAFINTQQLVSSSSFQHIEPTQHTHHTHHTHHTTEVDPWKFNATLRPYQIKIVNTVLHQLKHLPCHGALIHASPGAGKTVMAIAIAAALRLRTLFIAPNTELFNQILDEVKTFLPNMSLCNLIGQYKQKKRPQPNCVVCIGSLQTIMRRPVGDLSLEPYKFVIIDETHHITGNAFCQSVFACSPLMMLGMTATLHRNDRLGSYIEALVGPLVYQLKSRIQAEVLPVKYVHTRWITPTRKWNNDVDYVASISKLCNHTHRTRTIAKIIRKILTEDDNRWIICIGSRQQICIDLYHLLITNGIDASIITTRMKTPHPKAAKVLIGTSSKIGEGFSDKKRNTLILTCPYRGPDRVTATQSLTQKHGGAQLIQIIGRCTRGMTSCKPLIVDIQDQNINILLNHNRLRNNHYKSMRYTIKSPLIITEPK